MLAAVMMTAGSAGRVCGAVKTPVGEIVPVADVPPGVPLTLQLSAVLSVFMTLAVNGVELPSNTVAIGGAMLTEIGGVAGAGAEPTMPQPETSAASASETPQDRQPSFL